MKNEKRGEDEREIKIDSSERGRRKERQRRGEKFKRREATLSTSSGSTSITTEEKQRQIRNKGLLSHS